MSGPADSVLVIGAGISGLAAALELARRGRAVELWEAEEQAGGLLAPVHFRGLPCDRGAHRVHPGAHASLFRLWPKDQWLSRPRRGCLVLGRRHLPYPPRPLGFLRALGPAAALEMGAGFLLRPGAWPRFTAWEEHRRAPADEADEGFESFVLERVGRGAYRRFYQPYAEKVWGLPAARLSRSVAKQRVSMHAPWRSLSRALGALDERFLYPRRGMSRLIEDLGAELAARGVRRVQRRADLPALAAAPHRHLLFSGRLRDLLPEAGLEHRGLHLVHLAVAAGAGAPDTYYLPEREYDFGRASWVDGFCPTLRGPDERVLCVEIPAGDGPSELDLPVLLPGLVRQLVRAGILQPAQEVRAARHTWVPDVYPLYRRGWLGGWRRAMEALQRAEPRLWPIGRQGLFLHCNLDHCLAIAAEAVEQLMAGAAPERWLASAQRFLDVKVRD